MITLKDIAQRANVSVMTVSRVVNGHEEKVSKKTADRIHAIIKETGYIPNYSARSLSSKNSKIISLIMHTNNDQFNDPYTASMLGYIIKDLQNKGYFAMMGYLTDYKDVTEYMRKWNAEGAIFLGTFDQDILKIQEQNNIPLIFTDSYCPIRQLTNIGIDDYKGGVLAAEKFIENGHKHIAFVSSCIDQSGVNNNRYMGFKDTCQQHGISLPEENIIEYETIDQVVDELISLKDITGIFATSDIMAITIMDALREKGYSIPDDYSFIGFDNLPLSYFVTPKLTTIGQDIEKKATMTCKALIEHIQQPDLPSGNITLDVELIERNSVKNLK